MNIDPSAACCPSDPNELLGARVTRAALHSPPEWRIGQALFNALYNLNPRLADEIRGTDCDPFHNDDLAGAFMERIAGYDAAEASR